METREIQYFDLIQSAAKATGIPARLVAAIVKAESSYDPWACRYEPDFYVRYVKGTDVKTFAPCSRDTEARNLATSWGLMQVMGSTARYLGFNAPFLSALCDPMVGLQWGCTLLKRLKARHLADHGWAGVVAAYNAGSPKKLADGTWKNQAYVDKVFEFAGGAWPPKE
jgi:soluble lytic murein transglycosylase-like protein